MELLQTDKTSIRFGGLCAVNSVDFAIRNGEVVGLIGPNGSGKTTFFNLLTGIYCPSSGCVSLRGTDITGLPPFTIRQMGIARTFQSSRLCWNLSVLDNVLTGLYSRQKAGLFNTIFNFGAVKRELAGSIEKCLEFLGFFSQELVERKYDLVRNVPHIDRRRIEICRALVSDPGLLLLDEPSAGLNPAETMEMMRDISRIREKNPGTGIIIIEHDMDVISGVTDRVVVFNAGRKVTEGTFQQVSKNEEVIKAYLGGVAEVC